MRALQKAENTLYTVKKKKKKEQYCQSLPVETRKLTPLFDIIKSTKKSYIFHFPIF